MTGRPVHRSLRVLAVTWVLVAGAGLAASPRAGAESAIPAPAASSGTAGDPTSASVTPASLCLPVVCGLAGGLAGSAASDLVRTAFGVMAHAVAEAAVYIVSRVAETAASTVEPDLTVSWFQSHLAMMRSIALFVVVPLLLAAAISAVVHRDAGRLIRAFAVYLPIAVVGMLGVTKLTTWALEVTDDLSNTVACSTDIGPAQQAAYAAPSAYSGPAPTLAAANPRPAPATTAALTASPLDVAASAGVPDPGAPGSSGPDAPAPACHGRFASPALERLTAAMAAGLLSDPINNHVVVGVLAGMTLLAGLAIWLELLVRSAAVYVAVLFLPLALVGLVWPSTARWSKRMGELLSALIFSKFVIVCVLALGVDALSFGGNGHGVVFGAALLLLAAFAPFVILRLVPMVEAGVIAHLEGVGRQPARAAQAVGYHPALQRALHPDGDRAGGAGPAAAEAGQPDKPTWADGNLPGTTSAPTGEGPLLVGVGSAPAGGSRVAGSPVSSPHPGSALAAASWAARAPVDGPTDPGEHPAGAAWTPARTIDDLPLAPTQLPPDAGADPSPDHG